MSVLKTLRNVFHEKKLYFQLKRTKLSSHSVIIDCGANVGKFTSVFADRADTVICFEPNEHAFRVLKSKFGERKNITLYQAAVWTTDTELPLFHHVDSDADEVKWSTGSSIMSEKSNVSKEKYRLVKAYDLSKFIKALDTKIDVLKIDIEGAEVEVLNKLLDEGVDKLCGKILVETHPQIEAIRTGLQDLETRIQREGIRNIRLDWI